MLLDGMLAPHNTTVVAPLDGGGGFELTMAVVDADAVAPALSVTVNLMVNVAAVA
jgi:hypothetical protein